MTECHSISGKPHDSDGELRCICGSLLARLVPGGVELRCRRCKRSVTIPLEGAGIAGAPLSEPDSEETS